MQRKHLSDRRKAILRFIERRLEERGYPPTVREIGEAVGLSSSSSVQFHLNALRESGHLERDGSLTRALRVRRRGAPERPTKRPVYVPLVGRVAAGQPILAEEHIEDELPFPPDLVPEQGSFMLEVKGDSMIKVGILEGDHVLVQQQQTAENGDIVVAMVGDEATVKRFYRRGDRIELRPENDQMAPIVASDVTILGRVRAVVRRIA
jgi:repressor LexA